MKKNKLKSLKNPEIINFPTVQDSRGNLTFIQFPDQIPFEIQKIFWLYDDLSYNQFKGYAYRNHEEVIISLNGSIEVLVTEPSGKMQKVFLNKNSNGLYLPFKTFCKIENFSSNAIFLHISSKMVK